MGTTAVNHLSIALVSNAAVQFTLSLLATSVSTNKVSTESRLFDSP